MKNIFKEFYQKRLPGSLFLIIRACKWPAIELFLFYMIVKIVPSLIVFIASLSFFILTASADDNPDDVSFDSLILRIGSREEKISSEDFYQWAEIRPALYFGSENKIEIENINFCPTSRFLCDSLITERNRLLINKRSQITYKEDEISSFLEDLSRKINKDPIDAKFQVEDGKVSVFSLAELGVKLDITKSLEAITNGLELYSGASQDVKIINLSYVNQDPEIKSNSIDNMGITTLIGEGKSNFRGSPKNRIFNIKVATSRFNGVLIKPGEEFSFVKILGEVDGDHGYLPELVIKKDKTEPEFGGGICQVSTTTFRAAIYSGLEITARKNHAYPVAYYNPQGMDATVYVPRPDLRFINNTPGYILIQTKIEGTELVFQFYGTSDGRTVEIKGPKIIERQPDGSMKATFTQIVKDKDGNITDESVFNSAYDSPSKYPHPGEEKLTKKPSGWSDNEWKDYKKTNGL